MRIILFGKTGMLGNYIYNYLKSDFEIVQINRDTFDCEINSFQNLLDLFNKIKLNEKDVIINCIGLLPHIFKSDSLKDQNFSSEIMKKFILVNSIFPHQLEKISFKYSCKVIHVTSDCVFLGDKGNYNENDKFDLFNTYAITKTSGEPDQICTIRTSIIGHEHHKRHLLEWILNQKNKDINGYSNYIWNGLTCLELTKVIKKIIINNNFWKGVRHIYSPDYVSKYELCKLVNDIYNLNIKINEFKLPNLVNRTLSSIYFTKNEFNILPIKEQIIELKKFKI